MRHSNRLPGLHLVEFGGDGGIHQHTIEVARQSRLLSKRVVLHTSTDPELKVLEIDYCPCMNWYRDGGTLRKLMITFSFLYRTVPHLLLIPKSDTIWLQGLFKLPLTVIVATLLKAQGRRFVFSPHALFVRGKSNWFQKLLKIALKKAEVVVSYNSKDSKELISRHIKTLQIPLLQYIPKIDAHSVEKWDKILGRSEIKIGALGQIRADKNLTFLIELADSINAKAVIVGKEINGLKAIREAAEASANEHVIADQYLDMDEFYSLMSLLDVVVLPYAVASQSGVAEIAKALGIPVLTSDVGALSEFSDKALSLDEGLETWGDAVLGLYKNKGQATLYQSGWQLNLLRKLESR